MNNWDHIDITVQRPFQMVTIRPKTPHGKPRAAVRLNMDRRVMGGDDYHLLLIPYSKQEALGARVTRTKSIAPVLPDVPGVEGVDYGARPARIRWPMSGHLQFVRKDRVEVSKAESPWAG